MPKYFLLVLWCGFVCTAIAKNSGEKDQSLPIMQPLIMTFEKIVTFFTQTAITLRLSNPQLNSQEEIFNAIVNDPELTREVIKILKSKTRSLVISRKNNHDFEKSDREEVRQILGSFAGVMQCFFTIVQDPENKENVTNGFAGMLANILQAGKVIMKGTDILLDDDKETVQQWLTKIDGSHKKEMMTIFAIHNRTV